MYQSFKDHLQTGSQRPGVCRASEVQGERRVKLVCYAEPKPLLAVATCLRRQK